MSLIRRLGSASVLVCVGAAVLAFVIHRIATSQGSGITPDAVNYLDAADHLARGDGLVTGAGCTVLPKPLTHFPPLYPFALSGFLRLGAQPLVAARLLGGLLFGLNAALVAWLLLRSTRRPVVAALGAFVAVAGLPLLEVHTAAWSEPLFLCLFLVSVGQIATWLAHHRRRPLAFAAVALGAACLTRYAGVALVLGAILAVLILDTGNLRSRLVSAAVLGAVALAPLAAWLGRNARVTGDPVSRSPRLGFLGVEHAQASLRLVGSWIVPASDRIQIVAGQDAIVCGIVVLAVIGLLAAKRIARRSSVVIPTSAVPTLAAPDAMIPRVVQIMMAAYALFIFGSIVAFRDDPPIVDQRLFVPVFLGGIIVVAQTLSAAAQRFEIRGRRAIALGVLVVLLGNGIAGAAVIWHLHNHGRGFAGPDWNYAGVWAALAGKPGITRVYSNHPEAVFFRSGRVSCPIARPGVAANGPGQGVDVMNDHLTRGEAAMLVFHDARRFVPRSAAARGVSVDATDVPDIAARLGLVVALRERNAVLYARP